MSCDKDRLFVHLKLLNFLLLLESLYFGCLKNCEVQSKKEEVLSSTSLSFFFLAYNVVFAWEIRGVCPLHLASASSRNPIVASWLCQTLGKG